MRALVHKGKEPGTYLHKDDIEQHFANAKNEIEKRDMIIGAYMTFTVELAKALEAYRKDMQNLPALFALSAVIQNLSNLTIALQEGPADGPQLS